MHTFKFHSKRGALKIVSLMMLLAFSNYAAAQTANTNCQALVQLRNDLWLVRQDGSPVLQLTNDGKSKFASSMSQDGKIIAYSGGLFAGNITLLDTSARFLANIDLRTQDSVTGLNWIDPKLLRVQEHISPSSSLYHFVKIPNGSISANTLTEVAQAKGGSCALSPKFKRIACIEGDTISLKKRNIYYSPSQFSSATKLQTLDLNVGRIVSTSTDPSFKLEVKEISDKTIALKITTPDNLWQIEYVRIGDTAPVIYTSDASADRATVFGFSPRIKDKKGGVVTVDVMKSTTDQFSFEGGLNWDLRGRRLATIEANDAGQRSLLLLNRQRSDDNNDEENEDRDEGSIDAKILLPIGGPIRSVDFTSDTHIRVVGATQVFEQNIPAHGPIPANMSYTITPALPKQLTIKIGTATTTVPVQDWACR